MLVIGDNKFSNHYLENGVLYRGEMSKTIVKPVDGQYRVRFKRKDYFYTADELHGVRPIERPKFNGVVKIKEENNKTLNKLCKDFNTCSTVYRKWCRANGYSNMNESKMTLEDHTKILKIREEAVKKAEQNNITNLCRKFDVTYDAYRAYLRKDGKKPKEMSIEQHEVSIKKYRDIRHLKDSTSVKKQCARVGVDYGLYRSHLIKKGLIYSDLSFTGHCYWVEQYKKSLNK